MTSEVPESATKTMEREESHASQKYLESEKNVMPAWAEKGQTQNQNSQLCHHVWERCYYPTEACIFTIRTVKRHDLMTSELKILWILWIHELPQPKDTLFLRRWIKWKLHTQGHAHTNRQSDNQSAMRGSKRSRVAADTWSTSKSCFLRRKWLCSQERD